MLRTHSNKQGNKIKTSLCLVPFGANRLWWGCEHLVEGCQLFLRFSNEFLSIVTFLGVVNSELERINCNSICFPLTALLLDLLLVRVVKTAVKRRRPAQNRSDIFSTFFVERYSFPSGHATRAALCARFLLAQLVDTASTRVLVVGWASLVSLSRLLLARQYVTDVGVGLVMGYCQYSLLERLWVTWDCLQDLLLLRLSERLNRAYSGLWMAEFKH